MNNLRHLLYNIPIIQKFYDNRKDMEIDVIALNVERRQINKNEIFKLYNKLRELRGLSFRVAGNLVTMLS